MFEVIKKPIAKQNIRNVKCIGLLIGHIEEAFRSKISQVSPYSYSSIPWRLGTETAENLIPQTGERITNLCIYKIVKVFCFGLDPFKCILIQLHSKVFDVFHGTIN